MWVEPTEEYIIVEMDKPEEKSAGGVLLLDRTQDRMALSIWMGTVIHVGEESKEYVYPGDRIVLGSPGVQVKVDKRTFEAIKASDIVGFLREGDFPFYKEE